jgi:hypothetical protein
VAQLPTVGVRREFADHHTLDTVDLGSSGTLDDNIGWAKPVVDKPRRVSRVFPNAVANLGGRCQEALKGPRSRDGIHSGPRVGPNGCQTAGQDLLASNRVSTLIVHVTAMIDRVRASFIEGCALVEDAEAHSHGTPRNVVRC